MTKARDLANAGTALTTVSATELGYLDGVTSAVQTQLDAKIAKTLTTTTGDIIYASSANTPARLGIGSSAQVLTVASGVPSWATPSSGKVGQVLSTLKTDTFSTTSSSNVTITGLSQTITPSATSSKILIIVSLSAGVTNNDGNLAMFQISSGNTATYVGDAASNRQRVVHWVRRPGDGATVAATNMPMTMVYLDSPNTTSAVTYNAVARVNGGTAYVNRGGVDTDDGSWGRSASTITVMEILA
jgi:hypothetical protein